MSGGVPYSEALANYRILEERPLPDYDLETHELLQAFHPDHFDEAAVELKVGPNRGDLCHKQLAAMLQSDALIDEADLAGTNVVDTDVLVVGGGGAGCAAAIEAARDGARVILATKLRLGDSNTVMAEGGIQASIEREDTPQLHYDDTIKGGHYCADKELVAEMVMDAPDTIRWLIKQGMQFDLDEFGDLLTRRAGGTSANRVCYYRDYTGLEMMRVLREAVVNSDIDIWDYSPTVELMISESGRCAGAVLYDLRNNRYLQVRARSVVLATGGIGRMHLNAFPTSNHFGATGDGLVLAYRLGARLRELDSFQYHPTGMAYPKHHSGMLITEGVRSSGTWLLNGRGERFIDELSPRDVVAAAILRECTEGRGVRVDDETVGVWLDTPGLEQRHPGILQQRFPKLVELGRKSNIDPVESPLLIYPTLHYQNGGVEIDQNGQSNVPGLYCIGELSGGIHGKNRLMGNALLEIIAFGRRAGLHAAHKRHGRDTKRVSISHLAELRRELVMNQMPMKTQGPLLFPEYAGFNLSDDYRGQQRKG